MSAKNKVLPEIFDIIFTHLDTASLLNAILVCRTWHDNAWHLLWRHLHHPALSATFFDQLAKHGHRVQSLSLLLDSDLGSHGVVPMELTRVLCHTSRLTSFKLRLSHSGSPETVASLLRVIQDLLGPDRRGHNNNQNPTNNMLTKLDLGIGRISAEDAARFFPVFRSLTALTLSGDVRTDVLQFVMSTLPELSALTSNERQALDVAEGFTDETLRDLGQTKKLPQLTHLAITANSHVTALGLSGFVDGYQRLTSIDLAMCLAISTEGIERLVQKSTQLTHVRLNDTQTGDEVLRLLAAPVRAAQLRVLHVADCQGITNLGLRQVVMSCTNLEELDFSCSLLPLLGVFEGPLWSCTRLRVLRVGEQLGARAIHRITDSERRHIYMQLGRLWRLRELALDHVGSGLQLWEAGRAVIESLRWLETLSLQRFAYKSKDLIWLMTQLPGLRRLVITENEEHAGLIKDLSDINRRLVVVLEEFEADNSDSDSDDDDDGTFFYNPQPLYGFGLATDSESESDMVEEEDEEDSLDQSDEDEVPATYAGHFWHHTVSIDSDDDDNSDSTSDHNLHHSISDSSSDHNLHHADSDEEQAVVYHASARDGSEGGDDDDDDETIGYAHSTFSVYRSPYVSDDSQASHPDESDESDGNTISYPYSSLSAYRSFDEDDDDSGEESESDQGDVSSSDQDDSEEVEIEDSEENEEEEESEVEVESCYDSDETPPPPYESDSPADSSEQDGDDENEDDEEEESIVYSDESVEESDQSTPEASDVEVSDEEEEEEEEELDDEEKIDEEDEVEEEDLDEEDEIEEDEEEEVELEEDLDEVEEDLDEVEEDLDEVEEVEMEEEYYDDEDEIDDAPEDECDEDPYGDGSDDDNVYDYDDSD